jgi:hypothetical protein
MKQIKFRNIITNEFYKSKTGLDYAMCFDELTADIAQQADLMLEWLNKNFKGGYAIMVVENG